MKDEMIRYTLRTRRSTIDKVGFIAAYNGRRKNQEINRMLQLLIRTFEKKHGPIVLPLGDEINPFP